MWVWARHGNTFGPHDTVVYAGKRNDLPLVARGIEQAHRLADAWLAFGVQPCAIYSGSLTRLTHTAEIVCKRLGRPLSAIGCDARLDELDYGAWTGQTRDHVIAAFGEASVLAWETQAIWPTQAGWVGSAQSTSDDITNFVADVQAKEHGPGPILVISSNGRLRYALTQIPKAFDAYRNAQRLKVRTGYACVLDVSAKQADVVAWNQPPAVALGRLGRSISIARHDAQVPKLQVAPCSLGTRVKVDGTL